MKTRFILVMAVIACTLSLTNCSKKGCTDKDAENYCEGCKKDDGSCTYSGSMVFWYGKNTSDSLWAYGSTNLTFYVDGAVIGSSAVTIYNISSPPCTGGAAHVTKNLGSTKTKTFTYSVKDDFGDEIWSGTATCTGNGCEATELTW